METKEEEISITSSTPMEIDSELNFILFKKLLEDYKVILPEAKIKSSFEILENNGLLTKEAIQSLKDDTWKDLSLPLGVWNVLRQWASSSSSKPHFQDIFKANDYVKQQGKEKNIQDKDLFTLETLQSFNTPGMDVPFTFLTLINNNLFTKEAIQSLKDDTWKDLSLSLGVWNALRQWASPKLTDIIEEIYRRYPEYKCIIDKAEHVPVDTRFSFVGRSDVLSQLSILNNINIQNFKEKIRTKQKYCLPLIHGGLGIGKSRLGVKFTQDFLENLTTRNQFNFLGSIFIDFSIGDAWNTAYDSIDISVSLGFRLAAHFFFGIAANTFYSILNKLSWLQLQFLDFFTVMEEIQKKFELCFGDNELLLMIQLDEFQKIESEENHSKEELNTIIRTFTSFMIREHNRGICILPFFTGTDTTAGINSISRSQLLPCPILLTRLSVEDYEKTIYDYLNNDPRIQAKKFLEHWKEPSVQEAIDSLGRNPRNMDFFCSLITSWQESFELPEIFLSSIMKEVIDLLRDSYGIKTWTYFLGKDLKGPQCVCLFALNGKRLRREDKLNGITVANAESSGIIYLQEEPEYTFSLDLPLILLRAINMDIHVIDDHYLDFTKRGDDKDFEERMMVRRVLSNNLFAKLDYQFISYQELYPGAIGRKEDLARLVTIPKELLIVHAFGKQGAHESMHEHPLQAVPVEEGLKVLDISNGNYFVQNIPKAPSMDAYIHHPAGSFVNEKGDKIDVEENAEIYQFKSSEEIRRGEHPSSKYDLQLGHKSNKANHRPPTIWSEYNKITQNIQTFVGKASQTFVVVSNKPLVDFQEIQKNPSQLPPGTIIICNENFKKYVSNSLINRKIYLPPKR